MSQRTDDRNTDRHGKRRRRTARIPAPHGSFLTTRASRIPMGLTNGNGRNCYRNSTVQALLHAPLLVNWTRLTAADKNHRNVEHKALNKCWICSFDRLARAVWGDEVRRSKRIGERTSDDFYAGLTDQQKTDRANDEWHETLVNMDWHINRRFNRLLHLGSVHQQDAMDYFQVMGSAMENFSAILPLLQLPDDIKDVADYNLVIQGLLELRIALRWRCSTCGLVKHIGAATVENHFRLTAVPPGGNQLVALIDSSFRQARNAEHHCPCTPTAPGMSGPDHDVDNQILAAPRILMMNVVIGVHNQATNVTTKLQAPTIFPAQLDLTQYAAAGVLGRNQRLRYNLSSVVAHQGLSFDAGHYKNWAKNAPGNFSELNDSIVTPATQQDLLHPPGFTPYLITYLAEDAASTKAEQAFQKKAHLAAQKKPRKTIAGKGPRKAVAGKSLRVTTVKN